MRVTEVRPGMAARVDGKLYVVTKVEHRTPGNLRAFHQIKLRDVFTGQYLDRRYGSGEAIDVTTLDRRPMEYLFSDSSGHTFMDTENYDQITIQDELLGEGKLYLTANASVVMLVHDGNPVMVELPATVTLKITDTAPGIKGATATNQLKDATLETGLKTRVPPFIGVGESVKISTEDGSYQSRA
jgi:elongation factor P